MTKQIHLAAHFPGVNNTTVWSDPAAGSQIEFGSFRQFAQTAERGKFDFVFLAEGLRLREQNGLATRSWPTPAPASSWPPRHRGPSATRTRSSTSPGSSTCRAPRRAAR